nr:resistance to inhibitors of cholinesterase protein 3-like [Biomphalaria glabrata]
MSTLKAIGTVGIMIACFAIIYPRFMHPLVLRALGMSEPAQKMEDDSMFPPHYKNKPADGKAQTQGDDIRKHLRPGPHPGMRAAAEMQRQQAQQGSGRGMMGVVLPMYAIGIVLYLVYTLFKVFNKSKNNSWSKIGGQYEDYSVDRMGFPADFDGSADVHGYLQDQHHRKEFEDLLSRVDDKNVSTEEMRALQKRLEETEAQMTRILQAMQSVQNNVNRMATDSPTEKADGKDIPEQAVSHEEVLEDMKAKETSEAVQGAEGSVREEVEETRDVDLDAIDSDEDKSEKEGDVDEQNLPSDKNIHDESDSHVRQRRLKTKNEQ